MAGQFQKVVQEAFSKSVTNHSLLLRTQFSLTLQLHRQILTNLSLSIKEKGERNSPGGADELCYEYLNNILF